MLTNGNGLIIVGIGWSPDLNEINQTLAVLRAQKEADMLGNYGQRGWDLPPDEDTGDGEGGGKYTEEERLYRFRFKMADAANNPLFPGKPVTHRVLFVNGSPFSLYEHGLYKWRGCGHWNALCLSKNKIDDRGCPFCRKDGGDDWPAYIGMFGIIDLGHVEYLENGQIKLHHRTWKDKEGTVHEDAFPRCVLGAKKGSKKSPGVLKKLLWQAERRGNSLEGTVWDTSRSGDKEAGVGETWEYVDRIAPEDYVKYLQKYGADPEKLNVEPITNWREICKPVSYETMARIVGMGGSGEDRGSGQRSEGADYEGGQEGGYSDTSQDDIPF